MLLGYINVYYYTRIYVSKFNYQLCYNRIFKRGNNFTWYMLACSPALTITILGVIFTKGASIFKFCKLNSKTNHDAMLVVKTFVSNFYCFMTYTYTIDWVKKKKNNRLKLKKWNVSVSDNAFRHDLSTRLGL